MSCKILYITCAQLSISRLKPWWWKIDNNIPPPQQEQIYSPSPLVSSQGSKAESRQFTNGIAWDEHL